MDLLAHALDKASEESTHETLDLFYRTLLTSTLLVPERAQDQQLTNQPQYPNDFLNILGVKKGEEVFVPIFSSLECAREWSGHEIRTRSLKLSEVIGLLPEGWWFILNPGSESEKDLSPWEIDLLRGGEQNIAALIDEQLVEQVVDDVEVKPVEDQELSELKAKLVELAQSVPQVEQLYLVRESGKTASEKAVSSLILGILVAGNAAEQREEIQDRFSNLSALSMIGGESLKVRSGDSVNGNLVLGIFEGYRPFYQKKSSWLSKLFK